MSKQALDNLEGTQKPFARWLTSATIRALKTGAQAFLATCGTGLIGILDVDWLNLLSVTLMAMVMSYMASVAGLPEVDDGESLPQIIADIDA